MNRPIRLAAAAAVAAAGIALAFWAPRSTADEPGRSAVLRAVKVLAGLDSTRLVFETTNPITHTITPDSAGGGFRLLLRSAVLAPGVAISREFPDDRALRAYRIAETPKGLEVTVRMAAFGAAWGKAPTAGAGAVVDVPRPGHRLAAVLRDAEAQAAAAKPSKAVIEARRVDRTKAERLVVIDPGHGGDATGAVGPRRTIEKDVCLAIAQRIAEELQAQPGVRVVLTRSGDYNVGLRERYRMAELALADAFISIHANSGRRPTARGTEVYFLSLESASDEASKHLADVENAADMVGGVPPEEDEIVSILFDLQQQAAIRQSQELAESVLQHIVATRKLTSRGVKQAPFVVLKSPRVPSILVETAFINHPEEASLLRNSSFQNEIAQQISRGVLRYLESAPVIQRNGAAPAGAVPAGGASGTPANGRRRS